MHSRRQLLVSVVRYSGQQIWYAPLWLAQHRIMNVKHSRLVPFREHSWQRLVVAPQHASLACESKYACHLKLQRRQWHATCKELRHHKTLQSAGTDPFR
jgi:hypothetical protein